MAKFLFFIGIIIILIAAILGFASGSFMGIIAALGSGIASAAIFFALAMILENQALILSHIQTLPRPSKEKSTCSRCGKQYDGDMNSCPHCGYRD
jgi:hypothetical protein